MISRAIDVLPEQTAELVRRRIRDSATAERPVICPLLDRETGACLIYEARPAACRAYGFYAEREAVLGCERIERMGRELANVVWGNHTALEEELRGLGEQVTLAEWDLRAGVVDCMVSS